MLSPAAPPVIPFNYVRWPNATHVCTGYDIDAIPSGATRQDLFEACDANPDCHYFTYRPAQMDGWLKNATQCPSYWQSEGESYKRLFLPWSPPAPPLAPRPPVAPPPPSPPPPCDFVQMRNASSPAFEGGMWRYNATLRAYEHAGGNDALRGLLMFERTSSLLSSELGRWWVVTSIDLSLMAFHEHVATALADTTRWQTQLGPVDMQVACFDGLPLPLEPTCRVVALNGSAWTYDPDVGAYRQGLLWLGRVNLGLWGITQSLKPVCNEGPACVAISDDRFVAIQDVTTWKEWNGSSFVVSPSLATRCLDAPASPPSQNVVTGLSNPPPLAPPLAPPPAQPPWSPFAILGTLVVMLLAFAVVRAYASRR